jgi:hypothetical protein
MNTNSILQLLNALLGLTAALRAFGVNYREVLDAQEAAAAIGAELSQETIQKFVDQSQKAIDDL